MRNRAAELTLNLFEDGPQAQAPQQETAGLSTSADPGEPAQALTPQQETAGLRTSARIFAVDPGQREGATILHPDGSVTTEDFLAFVKTLQPGDTVCTESTMHVFRGRDRKEVIEAAAERGVEIWAMRSIFTSRARKELWPDKNASESKSDEADAKAIKHFFLARRNLFYRLRPSPLRLGTINEAGTPRFVVNQKLVNLRREGYPGYGDLHEATVLVSASVAHEFRLSMRAFDRLLGFNAAGYPQIMRSNRNKHGAGKKTAERKDKMKAYRQRARKAYQALRAQARLPQQETAGLVTSAPAKEIP